MARPLRIQYPGAWYHVMHRGANHQAIFLDDDDRRIYFSSLQKIVKIYGVEIHAFCLMDNHYHLIVHTPRGNLSEAMRLLNAKYTQIFNLRHARDGALFRGRYKAILISADDYLINVSRYIHLNPIEAGLARHPAQYKWSSYAYYLKLKSAPEWLVMSEVVKRFGQNCFTKKYKEFVETPLKQLDEKEPLYDSKTLPSVLGSKEFCDEIFEKIKSKSLCHEIVGKERIIIPPETIDILDAVSAYFKIDPSIIIQKAKRRIKTPARNIAIFLCRHARGMKLNDIGSLFGELSYSSISNRVKKVEKDAGLNKTAQFLLAKIEMQCKTLLEIEQLKIEGKI